ncbi:glycosyltransferase, partial [Escherichia coli]|nr:glycosyltransferase [Escherichia coli]
FVILTWNRDSMLKICIEKLIKSIANKAESEIIIFNNNSTDSTVSVLNEFYLMNHNEINIKIVNHKKNLGLNAYKKLMRMATGDVIIEVDDDVLEFPVGIDEIFESYLYTFKEFGFISLDVIKNKHTNGAKPPEEKYIDITRDGKTIQYGPTGGWCAGFRAADYKKISFLFERVIPLSFKRGEDAVLSKLFSIMGKKSGIIKDIRCLHATGPYYAKMFGSLERDIEKYDVAGIENMRDIYKKYQ